jgi:two-component system, OmpR family, KDP operon response regulator KdpE
MSTLPPVLVIDDELQIRRLLQLYLEAHQYTVLVAGTGGEGLRCAATERPEAIILDLSLPDMDGLTVLKTLREWSSVPVIILSVRNAEQDIVGCLDAGADDYLVKPFRAGELLARLRMAIRHRPTVNESPVFTAGDLSVDLVARTVRRRGESVKLTATEYSLMALFVRNAGRVLTHRYILEQVWGPAFVDETQYTRVYVGQLRKKLEEDPEHPRVFITEAGIGYRLAVES